ncbi:MAG: hypothetical protein K6B75_05320, partial [Lachnospiraceae bacterium]|nr:hypothetical protein [Lachnospiraceae bacterium]
NQDFGNGIGEEMPLTIGFALTLCLIFALVTAFMNRGKNKKLVKYLVLSFLAVWHSSAYFPWDLIFKVVPEGLGKTIDSIQFPWRFLALVTIFTVAAFCEALVTIEDGEVKGESFLNKEYIKYFLFAVMMITLITDVWFLNGRTKSGDHYSNFNSENDGFKCFTAREYLLQGACGEERDLNGRINVLGGDAVVSNYEKTGNLLEFDVKASEKSELELPLFNYWYYVCEYEMNDGSEKRLYVSDSDKKQVQITIPEGSSGHIKVYWKTPLSWGISYVVTIVSFVGLIVYLIPKRKREKKHRRLKISFLVDEEDKKDNKKDNDIIRIDENDDERF